MSSLARSEGELDGVVFADEDEVTDGGSVSAKDTASPLFRRRAEAGSVIVYVLECFQAKYRICSVFARWPRSSQAGRRADEEAAASLQRGQTEAREGTGFSEGRGGEA